MGQFHEYNANKRHHILLNSKYLQYSLWVGQGGDNGVTLISD